MNNLSIFRLLSAVGVVLGGLGVLWAGSVPLQVGAREAMGPTPSHDSAQRALLDRYCVTCHNQQLRTAGLFLDSADVAEIAVDAELWEKVVRKVRSGAMPPAGMPRPSATQFDALLGYLETELDRMAEVEPKPGTPVIRRLNRAEYANSIRDLMAVDTDAIDVQALLPADESVDGFDNNSEALSVSPGLLERYLTAARKIVRLALGDPGLLPALKTYANPKYLMQESSRMSEDLPFGSRGGMAVRHHFPLDGEYLLKVQLQRNAREYIRGLGESHEIDIRLDGSKIESFRVGGEKKGRSAGLFSSASQGDIQQEVYERTADGHLEVRIPVRAGTRVVGVSFPGETGVTEGPLEPRLSQVMFAQYKGGVPAVGSLTIGGPYDPTGVSETPSRKKIFSCHPSSGANEDRCAEEILMRLGRSAYRRPLADEDLEILQEFFESGRRKGGFEAGVGAALERILLGPEFLFRFERDPVSVRPGEVYRVSSLELASRLSFFLWSSLPDGELLELAEQGQLQDPAVLERQVARMLKDVRSKALVENFAGQWLYLRNLRSLNPDPEVFPYFDDNLRQAFEQETALLFESVLREDRSVLDLLRADYSFLNDRLAEHYGIPGIYGAHFRKVQMTDDRRRGLLGQGSILTVTSYANRTSPVLRGKWVLDNLLGTPPPPPPDDVPALKDRGSDGQALSVRGRMEQHRANPSCASCHKLMDPLGFALENFDAIGLWRTTDAGSPIDSSGILPDGTRFEGPSELRSLMLEKQEQFVRTVLEKLYIYALGRRVSHLDAPYIREILRETEAGGYRWSSLVLGIIKSVPFQMRRAKQS